jgi:hypothetical protein
MSTSRGHRLDTLKARRVAANLSVQDLARRTNTSDALIQWLENGDSCEPYITERLIDVFGPQVALTSSANGNPSQLTVGAHTFLTGDTVTITGHTGGNPDINGDRTVSSVADGTHIHINVNVTSPGTGGTVRLSALSFGLARL